MLLSPTAACTVIMEYPRDAPVSCFAVDSGIYKDVARSLSDAIENEIADCSYL